MPEKGDLYSVPALSSNMHLSDDLCHSLSNRSTSCCLPMAKTRAFAFIGPALRNQLPHLTRSCLLTDGPKCLFSLSQDLFLFSGSLALGAPLIGVHCERRYKN